MAGKGGKSRWQGDFLTYVPGKDMLPVSDLYLRVLYMFFLKYMMQMFCPYVLLTVAFQKKALERF